MLEIQHGASELKALGYVIFHLLDCRFSAEIGYYVKCCVENMIPHLLKVVLCELVCDPEQLTAGVSICKGPYAQTVGRIQLPFEKLAAGLLDLSQLKETSRWK